jgi:DNA polymerase III delta prime subunit
LAGLIDTDGYYGKGCYDVTWKSRQLAEDAAYLARSLGLCATLHATEKRDQNGHGGTYWRLFISGNLRRVFCRVARKKARTRRQIKNALHQGFAIVPLAFEEEYFGFTLDGDGRYLLDNFLVTHNTTAAQAFARDYLQAHGVLPPVSEISCPKLSEAPAGAFSEIRADSLPSNPEQAREVLTARLQNLARYGSLHGTPGTKRVVLVDDINKFAPSILDRLRPILERYSHNVVFLFTSNAEPERLLDPAILSRLTVLKFVAPDMMSIAYRLRQIAENEHLAHRLMEAGVPDAGHVVEEMITTSVSSAGGDVRSAIGNLQTEFTARMGAP